MAGQRQPTNLLVMKGKKHLTKSEIESRKNNEVLAPSDDVAPPKYLTAVQKREFKKIAEQLLEVGIITNLDCDALARFIISQTNYIKFTKIVNSIPSDFEYVSAFEKAVGIQDKAFKQCRAAASDLGLTISSRCKLVVPKNEKKQETDFDRKFGNV